MGTRIVDSLSEATQKQTIFLNIASMDYINDEREFQASIHGAKLKKQTSDVRQAGKRALKDPRKLKREK